MEPKEPIERTELRTTLRTTPRLKAKLDLLVAQLRSTDAFIGLGWTVSAEAIQNASWLWMLESEPNELARELLPYIQKVREIWPAGADKKPTEDSGAGPDSAFGVRSKASQKKRSG